MVRGAWFVLHGSCCDREYADGGNLSRITAFFADNCLFLGQMSFLRTAVFFVNNCLAGLDSGRVECRNCLQVRQAIIFVVVIIVVEFIVFKVIAIQVVVVIQQRVIV